MMRPRISTALLLASLSAAALGASAPLNVKTGAWQILMTTRTTGTMIPPAALQQMAPEQRARVAAAMKAREGKSDSHDFKSCVTADDLKTGSAFGGNATHQEVRMACSGNDAHSGTAVFDAPTPTTIIGKIDVNAARGGVVHVDMHGHWLTASCQGI